METPTTTQTPRKKEHILHFLENMLIYLSLHPQLQAECAELRQIIDHLDTWLLDLPGDPQADREQFGQLVRAIWVRWAHEQANPKPSWLTAWPDLEEPDREVDRRIGEGIALAARAGYLPAPS